MRTAYHQQVVGALTIGEVSDRTGVAVATLRVWELRHGFPVPQRLDSGHRRYQLDDIETIREVLRLRGAGMQLDAAIERAVRDAHQLSTEPHSIFAELRRLHPSMPVHRLTKATLIGLSHAIEDELSTRAERAVLFGGFQREALYRVERDRWKALARVSRATFVFADFAEAAPDGRLVTVPLPEDAPMRAEWVVGCDAPGLSVVLSAWQLPGQEHVPDRARRFDSLWTLDPVPVRDACLASLRVAAAAGIGTAALVERLASTPPSSEIDPGQATALVHRVLSYVDAMSKT